MSLIDIEEVARGATSDPEFKRETRYLTGALKLAIADEVHVLRFIDGRLTAIEGDAVADSDCKIVVRGDRGLWLEMLQPRPKPFFQCLQSTAVKHGLVLSDTNETFAYLPALNRLLQLMRIHHAEVQA